MGFSMSTPDSAQYEKALRLTNAPPDPGHVIACGRVSIADERDKLRVRFGTEAGAYVKGFPSKGGVYILVCSAIELDFLGLDRFETALPSTDPAEEDELCAKMRLLGALWWPSLEKYTTALWKQNLGDEPELKERFIGVMPQGGVWVLETDWEDSSKRQLGRIKNARDMEEKCRAIERFGGTFYADPIDCPLLDFKSPVPERAAIQVLVADNNADNLSVMQSLLVHLGFCQVTGIVADGKVIMDYLVAAAENKPKRKPDIIFFDMEAADGFDIFFLRQTFPYAMEYARAIFIGIEEDTAPNNAQSSRRMGLHSVLPRPVQEKQLEQTLVRYALRGCDRIWLSGSGGVGSS